MKRVIKTGYMLVALLLVFNFITMPVNAASETQIRISKISLSKKTIKPGDNLTVKLYFRTNLKLNKVEMLYSSPVSKSKEITLKPANKAKTTWKATFKLKKNNRASGTWGIPYIYVSGDNAEGETENYFIENNRWCLENGYSVNVKRQNLSAGNFKFKKS